MLGLTEYANWVTIGSSWDHNKFLGNASTGSSPLLWRQNRQKCELYPESDPQLDDDSD